MSDRDRFIAWVQAVLTFMLVAAFTYLLLVGKVDAATTLKDFVGMGVMFWLMRHRPNGASQDSDELPAPPADPPAGRAARSTLDFPAQLKR